MSIKASFLRNTYWARDYFKKSRVKPHYKDISRIQENVNGEGFTIQKKHLDNILKHAVANTKFYAAYDPENLFSFPVINKLTIQQRKEDFKAIMSSLPEAPQKIYTKRTSGSTGTPFEVLMDQRKVNRRIAELKYFMNLNGYNSHENMIQLRYWSHLKKPKLQQFRENIIPFNTSNFNEARLLELCNLIKKNKTISIFGYASSITRFVEFAVKNNIKLPSLKVITAGAEALPESTRVLVNKHMSCSIFSQYGNQENGILGQESHMKDASKNRLYLNHASYFFEILKLDTDESANYGELGRIVVTDLFNYAQPLIRYDTGDTGIMLEKDNYSNGYPFLKALFGRRIDLIFDIHNNPINPLEFFAFFLNYQNINQWQFIQRGYNDYLLKLNVKPSFLIKDCLGGIKRLLGGDTVSIQVEYVDNIPVVASGKYKSVINEWKK
jgi:phenylacetate-CoA ligase